VVIGIIALLAALLTPVVMQSLTKARNAAIKAEIDMLHMAIMNYRNEYGGFPPAFAAGINSSGTDAASKHLRRVFPRVANAGFQAQCLPYLNSGAGTFNAASGITTDTAIVAWLFGFNTDPVNPVVSTNGTASVASGVVTLTGTVSPRNKLYDFDTARINNFQYHPTGKRLSPYIYYSSSLYTSFPYTVSTSPWAHRVTVAGDPSPFTNMSQPFANPDTFQILCAGRDEIFGNDDDLSNFWPGTRREYLDSLKD
jgi:type II secretory pathway pseudopilin PulG